VYDTSQKLLVSTKLWGVYKQTCQPRFWTLNPPDPPVSWKTRLKFDWTVNDAFNLLAIRNLWGQLSLENIR